jgi:antitoxin CcdA
MSSASSRRRKVATNLSVRADLVRRARALKLNLSEVLETALDRAIRETEREAWLAANREAIDEYNAQVAKRGLFSDDWRRF